MRRFAIKYLLLFMAYVFASSAASRAFAQEYKLSELQKQLDTASNDYVRYWILQYLFMHHQANNDNKEAEKTAKQLLEIAAHTQEPKQVFHANFIYGELLNLQGKYSESFTYFMRAKETALQMQDTFRIIHIDLQLGNLFAVQNNKEKSSALYDEADRYAAKITDPKTQYITSFYKGISLMNIGKADSAIACFQRSLAFAQAIQDTVGIISSLANIGVTLSAKDPKMAEIYIDRYIQLSEAVHEKGYMQNAYNLKAEILMDKGLHKEALPYLLKAKEILDLDPLHPEKIQNYQGFSTVYEQLGDYKQALEYHKLLKNISDTLYGQEKVKAMQTAEQKYLDEQREAEDLVNAMKERNTRIMFILGLVALLTISLLLWNRYRLKTKANRLLEEKNNVIEEQHKNISDSIHYAKRIQEAILPLEENFKKALPLSFILFKPRDIVSGDFYWIGEHNHKIIVAAADCTGHGVPGAFMSMIGNTLLNEIVNHKGITRPDAILNELRDEVIVALKQKSAAHENKDGMDMAICTIDKNSQNIEFSGANIPLYISRQGELVEIKGDKQPVGVHGSTQQPFTLHNLQLLPGDTLYMFSDGYADQFGGPDKKKFMSKRFKSLLLSINTLPMHDQRRHLEEEHTAWKGDMEQVDDILVMGFNPSKLS